MGLKDGALLVLEARASVAQALALADETRTSLKALEALVGATAAMMAEDLLRYGDVPQAMEGLQERSRQELECLETTALLAADLANELAESASSLAKLLSLAADRAGCDNS